MPVHREVGQVFVGVVGHFGLRELLDGLVQCGLDLTSEQSERADADLQANLNDSCCRVFVYNCLNSLR